jgi:hypothetical protein
MLAYDTMFVSTQNSVANSRKGMVLVFSTSVESTIQVHHLASFLNSFAGEGAWNFALEDPDRILRIVSDDVNPSAAIELLREHGYECKELE